MIQLRIRLLGTPEITYGERPLSLSGPCILVCKASLRCSKLQMEKL
jgi:hypothetical protein